MLRAQHLTNLFGVLSQGTVFDQLYSIWLTVHCTVLKYSFLNTVLLVKYCTVGAGIASKGQHTRIKIVVCVFWNNCLDQNLNQLISEKTKMPILTAECLYVVKPNAGNPNNKELYRHL